MSSPTSGTLLAEILALSRQLVDREQRQSAARTVAALFDADDLLLAIYDAEVEAWLPAPGFPQTLPDGTAWQSFFAANAAAGQYASQLRPPGSETLAPAVGVAADEGTQVVLLGGAPRLEGLEPLRMVLPLLAAAFRGERATQSALAQAALAKRLATDAEALALSLDVARARVEALAVENGRLYREAQEAVKLRDQFLGIASHELKTPVASIKMGVQLLLRAHQRGVANADRALEMLRRVDEATDRLAALTNDLQDVSMVQAGRLTLWRERLDLAALVERLVAERKEDVPARYALRLEAHDEMPPLLGDVVRLQQVATNLLDNAIKYSPAGGLILVQLVRAGNGALLRVRDEGIGLPAGSEKQIFEPFGRAENAQASHVPGMGLGLHICRQIVEQHGGSLRLVSEGEQRGTTAEVWLPAAPAEAEVSSAA